MMTVKTKDLAFLLAILSITVGQVAWFLCLPALPQMQNYFQMDQQTIALTSALFFFGMGPSQFIYGPLSDYYGRKPILIFGVSIFIAASLIAFFATTIGLFLIARFIQGVGVGACSTLGRAIPRDKFTGFEFAKKSAQLSMALSIMPLLAPTIGSYIQYFFSWRASFFFMVCYGILILGLAMFLFQETNLFATRHFSIRKLLNDYKSVLANRQFVAFLTIGTLTLSCEIVLNTFASFILQNDFGLTAIQYGWTILFLSVGFLFGAYTSNLLLNKNWTIESLIQLGIVLAFLSGFGLFSFSKIFPIQFATILPMLLFSFSMGLIYPNAATGAMNPFKEKAGVAGALLSALQLLSAGLISTLLMKVMSASLLNLSLVFVTLSILSAWIVSRILGQQFLLSFIFIKK